MSPPRKFSDAALRTLVEAGLADKEIAARLGVSRTAVWLRRDQLSLPRNAVYPPAEPDSRKRPQQPCDLKQRTCLRCREIFHSEGKHNRICTACKGSSAWRSGGDFEMRV